MRFIKFLWACGISMFLVVLVATICSYLQVDTSWYENLDRSVFVPSLTAMSVWWTLIYCTHIFVLTRAVLERVNKIKVCLLVLSELFWIAYFVVFWYFKSPRIGVIFLFALIVYLFVIGVWVLRCDTLCAAQMCIEIGILCYLATALFWQFYIG